ATAPVVSEYLAAAVRSDAPIVMALDLHDMLDPVQIRPRVAARLRIPEDDQRLDRLAGVVAGLRGVRLEATVDDAIAARLSLDFSAEVAPFADDLDKLFHDVIGEIGLSLEEFQDVRGRAAGKSL